MSMAADLRAICRYVEHNEAAARLSVAAPYLYRALRSLVAPDGKSVYGTKKNIAAAVAALEKVEGTS